VRESSSVLHRRVDEPRKNRVDADRDFRECVREGARDRRDRRLGRGVGCDLNGRRQFRRARGHVHDCTAGPQTRADGLAEEEHRLGVDGHDRPPVLAADLEDRLHADDPGCIHEEVRAGRVFRESLLGGRVGDIDDFGPDPFVRELAKPAGGDVHREHIDALRCEAARRCTPDAAGSPGDDCPLRARRHRCNPNLADLVFQLRE
jgi:hypothetical protein